VGVVGRKIREAKRKPEKIQRGVEPEGRKREGMKKRKKGKERRKERKEKKDGKKEKEGVHAITCFENANITRIYLWALPFSE